MLSLTIWEWIYVFSVALQLSGAVLLLIKYSFVSIEKGILENKKKETHVEGHTLIMGSTQPTASEYAENVWLNRIAFALIALGYLLGVFGVNTGKKIVLCAWILILSMVLTTLFAIIAKKKSSKQAN